MLRRIGLAVGLLSLLSANAWAGSVSSLSAVTSVGGTDLFYDVQTPGAGGLKATGAQVAAYTLGLVTGDCTISGTGTIACSKIGGVAPGAFFSGTDAGNLTGTLAAARLPGTASFAALTASTSLTLSAITGSAQCLHVNTSGLVSGTGSDCGSGGGGTSPGGTSGQIQFNNAGVFGGLTVGAGLASNGTSLATSSPNTVQTASGTISSIAGIDVFNGSSLTATLPGTGTLGANQTAMVSNINASALTISNTQTVSGLGLATKLHQFGFYGYIGTGSQAYGFGFPGFDTITTNALPKFSDASGASTASSVVDNGSGVVVGSATGGAQGAGSVNAQNLFVNGVAVAAGGNVSNSGTPTSGQIAQWTDSTHIQGVSSISVTNFTATGLTTVAEVLGGENDQSGTTYTLVATDCGKTVAFSNASAVTVTIAASIVPAAGATCNISIRQDGAGQVAVNGTAVSAATLVSAHSYTKTFGQHSIIGLQLTTISATTTAVLTGDGA
jgi:hypothetical protein